MRLPSQGTAVETDGDFGPSDFHIEISAHAFSVLSKGLYSDPFKAIVRELACNAWDAHVEAKTTHVPFELYLPNALAPVFKIRDFGVGLSEKSIREIYTTYFKSTKQGSDEMTGCFGLGSKSPYAYTKKFTIVSYFNGVCYHYNAVINEKGYPQIMKMGESETTERNGLEVSFAVKEEDFGDFRKAAEIALRPFVVKPIVKGDANFVPDLYPDTAVLEGKGWKLFSHLEGGNLVTMGNVEYPIEYTRSGFSSNALKVLGLAMVIDFPLGSFEITPSRESVQWTEFSVHSINDRLEQIHDEIVELVSKKIEDAPTLWEATTAAWEFLHNSGVKKLGITPTWKGRQVKQTVEIPSDKGITVTKFTAVEARRNSKSPNSASLNKTNRIDPVPTTFYLADFAGAEYRLGNFVRDSMEEGDHVYLVSVVDAAALKVFCNAIGISQKSLVMASTIPKRTRTYTGGTGGTGRQSRLAGSQARAFTFKMDGNGYSDAFWDEAEIDLDEPDLGVYIEINRWNPLGTCFGDKPQNIRSALRALKGLGVDLPDGGLIGIKTAHKAKFEEHENWKPLDLWIREKLVEIWYAESDFRYAVEFFGLDHTERNRIGYFRSMTMHFVKKNLLDKESYLAKFCATFERIYKWEKRVGHFGELKRVLESSSDGNELSGQICLVYPCGFKRDKPPPLYSERLIKRYPLMELVSNRGYGSYSYSETRERDLAISEYIRMMDDKATNAAKAPSAAHTPPAPVVAPATEVTEEETPSDEDE